MHLFVRIREDLDHVQTVSFPGSDQYRIERATQELNQLRDMQDRGRYNQWQLDDVVMALGRILADNRLAARDRDLLNDDLNVCKTSRRMFATMAFASLRRLPPQNTPSARSTPRPRRPNR